MKLFVRTSNNYTYILLAHQHHNLLGLSTLCVKIWNEMPNEQKFVQEIPQKRNKKAPHNILETEDSYIKPDEIMVKFKHGKIETNWTCSCAISLVHLDTQDFFSFTMNVFHFPFSFLVYLLMFFSHVLFSYLLSTKSAQIFQNFIFFS